MLLTTLLLASVMSAKQDLPFESISFNIKSMNLKMPGMELVKIGNRSIKTGQIEINLDSENTAANKPFNISFDKQIPVSYPYTVQFKDVIISSVIKGVNSGFMKVTHAGTPPTSKQIVGGPTVETGDIEIGKDEETTIEVNNTGGGTVIIVIEKHVNVNCKKMKVESMSGNGTTAQPMLVTLAPNGATRADSIECLKWLNNAPRTNSLTAAEKNAIATQAGKGKAEGKPMTIAVKISCAQANIRSQWVMASMTISGQVVLQGVRRG